MESRKKLLRLFKRFTLLIMLVLTGLSACKSLPAELTGAWNNLLNRPKATPSSPITNELTPEITQTLPTMTPTPVLPPDELILWLPARFDPQAEGQAALVLQNLLDQFAQDNQIEINVRIKKAAGIGGMIDVLEVTQAAAPAALPDLVILDAPSLATAVKAGLLFSSPGLEELANQTDWYNFARKYALVGENPYAVTFLGDPLVMVYDSRSTVIPSNNWFDISENYGFFAFAADDPQASLMFTLYAQAGGLWMDDSQKPTLSLDPLTQVLQLLQETQASKHLREESLSFRSSDQVWQMFNNFELSTAVVKASTVIQALQEPANGKPVPAITQPALTMAEGWVGALANPDPARQALALELLNYLLETQNLASWSEALHLVPGRPSALGVWNELSIKPALENIAGSALSYPPDEVMEEIAPALRNAALLILRDNALPEETAKQALEAVR